MNRMLLTVCDTRFSGIGWFGIVDPNLFKAVHNDVGSDPPFGMGNPMCNHEMLYGFIGLVHHKLDVLVSDTSRQRIVHPHITYLQL
jgi:hypothetical protein